MNKLALISAIGVIFFACPSCEQEATKPNTLPDQTFSFQSSKCLKELLKKALYDSTFVYTFTDTLSIDFSVRANCCPDSNRFNVSWLLTQDTIKISVRDFIGEACLCTCQYMIHAALANLPENHYVVECFIDNSSNGPNPFHSVNVYRNPKSN